MIDIADRKSITQIKCHENPDHIFTEAWRELSIEDSIGCDMVTYWQKYKAADEKAKVTVDVLIVINNKAPKFSAEINASDFFVSDLEDFCKKIVGPTKRRLCKEIAEYVGDNKITHYTTAISQKPD